MRTILTLKQKRYLWEELAMCEVYIGDPRENFEYWKDFEWSLIFSNEDEDRDYPYSLQIVNINVGKEWLEWDSMTTELANEVKNIKY